MKLFRNELILKDIYVQKNDTDNVILMEFHFIIPWKLRDMPIEMLNSLALSEIKKRIKLPFAEDVFCTWGDPSCKSIKKTIMFSCKSDYQASSSFFCVDELFIKKGE